jgi:hypothetical protein
VDQRLVDAAADRVDRILISISSPAGIESLPREEAEPLLGAYAEGAQALPAGFDAWGAIPLHGERPGDVDDLVERGFVGLALPAGAITSPAGLRRLEPILARLEHHGAPLLVHPGPSPWRPPEPLDEGDARWWPALTRYVFDMQAAWLSFVLAGRPAHPDLKVVFAMLAGCAPLHSERLAARGGPAARVVDPLCFYDSSSYGAVALDAMIRSVGVEQIVYGSDRPVVDPPAAHLGEAVEHAMRVANPARLLSERMVAA